MQIYNDNNLNHIMPGKYGRGRVRNRGIIMLLTIVALVVLATITYTVSTNLSTRKRQQQYLIDYQNSVYACDSAVKYSLATIEDLKIEMPNRVDYLDFSDVFTWTKEEYDEYVNEWALYLEEAARKEAQDREYAEQQGYEYGADEDGEKKKPSVLETFSEAFGESRHEKEDEVGLFDMFFGGEDDGPGDSNSVDDEYGADMDDGWGMSYDDQMYVIDPNKLEIPGPYGPAWPNVVEPIEVEIEDAKVTIEIHDENAKMPIIWAIMKDEEAQREANAAFVTFCEWMEMRGEDIDLLLEQLDYVRQEKDFTPDAKDITKTKIVEKEVTRKVRTARSKRRRTRTFKQKRVIKEKRPATAHKTDFAMLLHSTLLDREVLAKPIEDTGQRYEAAVKYLSLWGADKVNVNTAPRHVLEAAFTFSGQAAEVAQEIIVLRKEEPFESMEDLKDRMFAYSNYIDKAEKYITTVSTYFSIHVTASSGTATTTAVVTVIKNDKKVDKLAVLYY